MRLSLGFLLESKLLLLFLGKSFGFPLCLFFLSLNSVRGLIYLGLVSQEDLHENNVGCEDEDRESEFVHDCDDRLLSRTDDVLDVEYDDDAADQVVKHVADADQHADQQVHPDVLELGGVEIILFGQLLHLQRGFQHDDARDHRAEDVQAAKDKT